MRSMTGFGFGEAAAGGVTVKVELRAVNHRFLDLLIKLPTLLTPLESEVLEFLKGKLSRGRISCFVQLEQGEQGTSVVLDENRLAQGLAQLQEAARSLEEVTGRKQDITLDQLLAIPELFRSEEAVLATEESRTALLAALATAVTSLLEMKEKEGRELATDLAQRVTRLRALLSEVTELAPQSATEALARLRARLAQLVDESIDPQRLAQEAAILADRSSIAEECERLASHLEQFDQALAAEGQVAKRLNFLLQEMHREVNTMGSKTSLLAITQSVINMKDEIEALREQVQNLE
jgi:uncharacterized protein (TIGR00255 family)